MSIWTKIKTYITCSTLDDKRQEHAAQNATDDEYDHSPILHDTPDTVKILAISDLHWSNNEDWAAFKEAVATNPDVVCMLGDIDPPDARYIASIVPKNMQVLYVLGNHDKWGYYDDIECLTDTDGKPYTLPNGTVIGGVSGAPRYKADPDWAMRNEEECKEALDGLGHVDILLSHESLWHMIADHSTHSGFQAITDYVEKEKPALHLFGHHHQPEEIWRNGTKHICVFRCALISYPSGQVEQVF